MPRKSAQLAASRVEKLNRLRTKQQRLQRAMELNEAAMRRMQKLAFEALPDDFGICMPPGWTSDEPMFVVDANSNRVEVTT